MAQLVVRNLENSVKAQLHRRAKRHGRSMEEEAPQLPGNIPQWDSRDIE